MIGCLVLVMLVLLFVGCLLWVWVFGLALVGEFGLFGSCLLI